MRLQANRQFAGNSRVVLKSCAPLPLSQAQVEGVAQSQCAAPGIDPRASDKEGGAAPTAIATESFLIPTRPLLIR
jgi:hypothetical protein